MTRRDGVLHQTKRPKAFAERAQADRRHKGQKGTWKNRESPSRKAGGEEKLPALSSEPPLRVTHSWPLLLVATRLGSSKESGPRSCGGVAKGDREKTGKKGLPVGWGSTVPPGLTRPARGLFSFISDASTPQAATSQLTQLAMEHSPNTLPISATSQEQRMPTRWRHHLLSPFPAYLLTTTHFRRRAHPAPQPASLPSRPGPAGAGHRAGFRTRRPGFLASVVPR